MTLSNLVGKGLEKAETDAAEVARYLEKIRRKLDEYRKKRSLGLYQADFEPSEKEVASVTAAVERLRDNLVSWIRKNRPELLRK
jgi:hypothetical protein